MLLHEGSGAVPIIYTAHHASHDFHSFASRVALTNEQRLRFSDYGTEVSVPTNGIVAIIADHSRALGDLNRSTDDPTCFDIFDFAQPTRNPIWLPGQELDASEKAFCLNTYHEPFHNEVLAQLQKRTEPTLVVAWDNTADYHIGLSENGQSVHMPNIVLSNRGSEHTASNEAEKVSCDPELLLLIAEEARIALAEQSLHNEVYLNLVFKGGHICQTYSSLRNETFLKENGVQPRIQSLQVEYNTSITHDQVTLQANNDAIQRLRSAMSVAFERAWIRYITV